MRGHRPVGSIGALFVAASLVMSACTGGDDDASTTTTSAPSTTESTMPTYDLDRIAPGPLGDLAGCDGSVGTVVQTLTADIATERVGEEIVVEVDCEGRDLGRILLLEGPTDAATLLSEPIVAVDPQLIGIEPVRMIAYQPDGERVLQTVYRWDEGRLRAMSEAVLDTDQYLEAIGAAVEAIEPLSRADLFDQASPAVVSLEGITCGGNALEAGTGFIIAPDLVVTAAHVVEDYEAMTVRMIDGAERPGETIGFAPGQDAALIRMTTPVAVTPLEWSDQTPRVGSDISVLGYPLNLDLSVTAGTISGVGRTILFPNGEQIPNVMQTDALTNPGNSGGPWLDETGRVIGLHIAGRDGAAGINWGVAAEVVQALVEQWASEPQPYQPCDPPEEFLVRIETEQDQAEALAELFSDYAGGITSGDFDLAHARLWQPTVPVSTWSADLATSTWSDVAIVGITAAPADRVEEFGLGEVNTLQVRVTATTNQAPRFGPDGQECTNWNLVYLVASVDGVFWQIVSSAGSEFTAC